VCSPFGGPWPPFNGVNDAKQQNWDTIHLAISIAESLC
jgi:hypothetical protein